MANGSTVLNPDRAAAMRAGLETAWRAMTGNDIGAVDDDLDRLAEWFGPPAKPAAVRRRLARMEPVKTDEAMLDFDPPLALSVDGRTVVTPEGRVVLEQLLKADDQTKPVRIAVDRDRRLADLYREWALARVRSVGAVRTGQVRRAERPPAVGLAVLLLLHGAEGPDRALVIDRGDAALEAAVREMLIGFADALTGRPSRLKEPVWKFPIACAQRRFAAVQRATEGNVERFWLAADAREELVQALAEELVVVRRSGTPERAESAVRALAADYAARRERPFGRAVSAELLDDLSRRFAAVRD